MVHFCPNCGNKLHVMVETKNAVHLYCLNCSKDKTHHWFFYLKKDDRILSLLEYSQINRSMQ